MTASGKLPDQALQVRQLTLGERLPTTAEALEPRLALWLMDQPHSAAERQRRDSTLRLRFAPLISSALAGELDAWAGSPRRRLSLVLLLDTFTRILHAGTARAFEGNARALALTLSGVQSGADAALDVTERIFFYAPLQHSESVEVQQESLAAYRRLAQEAVAALRPALHRVLALAEARHALIVRFGRFPERNRLLNRSSTPAESAYLAEQRAGAQRPA